MEFLKTLRLERDGDRVRVITSWDDCPKGQAAPQMLCQGTRARNLDQAH